jgi:hypothetical protein
VVTGDNGAGRASPDFKLVIVGVGLTSASLTISAHRGCVVWQFYGGSVYHKPVVSEVRACADDGHDSWVDADEGQESSSHASGGTCCFAYQVTWWAYQSRGTNRGAGECLTRAVGGQGSRLVVDGCRFEGSTVTGDSGSVEGAGVYVSGTSDVSIQNSTFVGSVMAQVQGRRGEGDGDDDDDDCGDHRVTGG